MIVHNRESQNNVSYYGAIYITNYCSNCIEDSWKHGVLSCSKLEGGGLPLFSLCPPSLAPSLPLFLQEAFPKDHAQNVGINTKKCAVDRI